jgi:HEPN domain-containing protein
VVGFVKYYEVLLQKAAVDMRSATILYNDFQNGNSVLDIEVILFHLQQAAEKCLKAVLSFHQINYQRVHDLEVLVNLITENNIPLQINSIRLIDLSDFAVEGRYSVIHDDLVDAEKYFEEINQLYQQVNNLISANWATGR